MSKQSDVGLDLHSYHNELQSSRLDKAVAECYIQYQESGTAQIRHSGSWVSDLEYRMLAGESKINWNPHLDPHGGLSFTYYV